MLPSDLSLHPTLVNIVRFRSEMIQPDFNIVFFVSGGGGGGELEGEYFFVVAIAFKSSILKHDTSTSIFLNISVQDCGFYSKIINDSKVLLR